jgi:hypothetical protein
MLPAQVCHAGTKKSDSKRNLTWKKEHERERQQNLFSWQNSWQYGNVTSPSMP